LALEKFHFGVEALGDSVVAGEAPHASDFLAPAMKSVAERYQWCEFAATIVRAPADFAAWSR